MSLAESIALLARRLNETGRRIVLAESCTGGLIAASLAEIPGISDRLCGGFVTYRNASKHAWLGVSQESLDQPGPVSETVAIQMASGALQRTPEADLAVSITGHLGPGAPPSLDGVAYCGTASRGSHESPRCHVTRLDAPGDMNRVERQRWIAEQVAYIAIACLDKENFS